MKLCNLLKELSRYTDAIQTEKYGERRNYSFGMLTLSSLMGMSLFIACIGYVVSAVLKYFDNDGIIPIIISTISMGVFIIVFVIRCLLWFKRDVGDIKYFLTYTEGVMFALMMSVNVLVVLFTSMIIVLTVKNNEYTYIAKIVLYCAIGLVPVIILWFFSLAFINIVHFEIKDYKRKKESER